MTSLLLPSRRGFLGVLAGALAAPLVVRAESLMPVRTVTWGMSPKTAADYARSMNQLLRRYGADTISKLLHIHGSQQSYVECTIGPSWDPKFVAQHNGPLLPPPINEMARELHKAVGNGRYARSGLELDAKLNGFQPHEYAVCSDGGVQVRAIQMYDIRLDAFVTRFDVRHT